MPKFVSKKNINKVVTQGHKKIAKLAGELFNVYRPDYSVVDNDPVLTREDIYYRVDTGGKRFLEIGINQVTAYDTFGPQKTILPGDLLIPGTPTDYALEKPVCTLLHWGDAKALVALRTSKKCSIAISQDEETEEYTYLYENVFFDLLSQGFTNGQISQDYARQGIPVNTDKFVLFYRENLANGDYQGLTLIELNQDGSSNGKRWTIDQIDWTGNVMMFTVKRKF